MTDISPALPPSGANDPLAAGLRNGSAHRQIEVKSRPSQRLADSIELSERAMYLDRLRSMPRVREHVISGVRDAIETGSYSIDDKLPVAIERLLDDLGG